MPAVRFTPVPGTPAPKVGSNQGGTFTPGGFVPNKPKVIAPPNQAPYKPGRSPAQTATKSAAASGTVQVVSEPHAQASASTMATQRLLNAHGAHLKVDGQWGPATESAYQAYLQSAKEQPKQVDTTSPLYHAPVTPETVHRQVAFEATPQGKASTYMTQLYHRGYTEQNMDANRAINHDLQAGLITEAQAKAAWHTLPKPTQGYLSRIPGELKAATLGQAEGIGGMVGRDIIAPAEAGILRMLPGYTRGNEAQTAQTAEQNSGNAASDVVSLAKGFVTMPVNAAEHPLRNPVNTVLSALMVADPALRVAGALHFAAPAEVADAARLAQASPLDNPVRTEIEQSLMGSRQLTDAQIQAAMFHYDTTAYVLAKQLGITPDAAMYKIWAGAEHVPTTGVPESYPNAARLNDVGQNPNARAAVIRDTSGSHTLVVTNRTAMSSVMHEMFHAIEPHLPPDIRARLQSAYADSGAEARGQNYDEFAARNFEAWLAEGHAPVPGLDQPFAELAPQIQKIYAESGGVPASSALTHDLRNIFSEIYARSQAPERGRFAQFMNWQGLGAARAEFGTALREASNPRNLLRNYKNDFLGQTAEEKTFLDNPQQDIQPEAKGALNRAARRILRDHGAAALPDHVNTPAEVTKLLRNLREHAVTGAGQKGWYQESAHAILDHVGHNVAEAKKLAGLIAVYSPRAEVYSKATDWNNLGRALNAYDEYRSKGEIGNKWSISSHKEGEGDWQTTRANQIMNGTFDWQGLKTNRFFRNFLMHISPDEYVNTYGHDPITTTQDTWMRRAFGYAKSGTKANGESISPKMYGAMDHATTEVAKSLGWSPEEAQAAIWTSVKAQAEGTDLAQAGLSFKQAFEARPGDLLAQEKVRAWSQIAQMAGEKVPARGIIKSARALAKADTWLAYALRNDPSPELTDLAAVLDRADHVAQAIGDDSDLDALFGPDPMTQTIASAQGHVLLDTKEPVERLQPADVAAALAHVKENQGGTFTRNYKQAGDLQGVMVAHGAFERVLDHPVTEADLRAYRNDHLRQLNDPENHIGVWEADGKTYLDISRAHPPDQAVAALREQGQLAGWDLQKNEEVPSGLSEEDATRIKAGLKMREAVPGARVTRGKLEALRTQERGKRFGEVKEIWKDPTLTPMEKHAASLEALKGVLPTIDFKGFDELTPEAVHALMDEVQQHPGLSDGQKIRLGQVLMNIGSGDHPTPSELDLMAHVWGKTTADGVNEMSQMDRSIGQIVVNVMNIPRTVMATLDFSFPLRQGLLIATKHPMIFGRELVNMFRAWKSEDWLQNRHQEYISDPMFPLMQRAGLHVGGHEEVFGGVNYAEKLPVAGHAIRAADRAYSSMGEGLRFHVFKQMMNSWQDNSGGIFDRLTGRGTAGDLNAMPPEQADAFLKSLGNFINTATGRGDGGKIFEDATGLLNATFFSPRLMRSRWNMLSPRWYMKQDKFVRMHALRSLFQLAGTATLIVGLASRVPGVTVVTDPRNPDWGKIKFANGTRIDIGGGFQQWLRLGAQLLTNTSISSTTGKASPLNAGGFGKATALDMVLRFVEGKAAPIPGVAIDALRGSNASTGSTFNIRTGAGVPTELANHITPLIVQDMWDMYNHPLGGGHGGLNGIMSAALGYPLETFGLGVQTYTAKQNVAQRTKYQKLASQFGLHVSPAIWKRFDNESEVAHIRASYKGDYKAQADKLISYYAQQTGRHTYDRWIGKELSDVQAQNLVSIIASQLVGPSVSAYKRMLDAREKAAKAHG